MEAFIDTLAPEGIMVASKGDQLLRVSLPVRYSDVLTLVNELTARGARSIDFNHEEVGNPQLVIWTGPAPSRFYWTPFLLVIVGALYYSSIVNALEGLLP